MSDQATKTQNAVLKELINGSWNAIGIISLESKFIYINKAFAPVLGYSESEILKLKLIDMMIPKYKTPFNDLLKENIENQYKNRITVGCLRKDNQIVYLDIVIKLMSNNKMFVINASDVTTDVAEQKLINKFIVQYHMDKDGKILKTSDAFNRLSGNSSTELIFTSYIDLLHSSNNEDIKNDFISHINAHKPWKGNLILKKHDGSPFYVDFISKPSKNKYGDVLGHTAVMMDISSEIKLQKNEEILQEKVSDGEERLAIISDTMRTVAHEWRQPLNTISLDAQALLFDLDFEEEISKENMHEKLTSISEHTQDLSSIIKNFQEITELKGSKKKRNIKDILLEAIKISDLYEKEFVKEDYQETTSFRTYPKELSLAISSILINAKEITANKEDRVINIVTSQKDNTIICEISNNGGHIPEDIMDKIFTPYFSTKDEKNGVGLSLYNCKIIIELHLKGTIKVENLGEDIVMFRLTFPMGALE